MKLLKIFSLDEAQVLLEFGHDYYKKNELEISVGRLKEFPIRSKGEAQRAWNISEKIAGLRLANASIAKTIAADTYVNDEEKEEVTQSSKALEVSLENISKILNNNYKTTLIRLQVAYLASKEDEKDTKEEEDEVYVISSKYLNVREAI